MSWNAVFISYSHDAPEHREWVLSLSERLREDGFETLLDQYVNGSPAQGWPRWMLDQLDAAAFVLVVCTETYYRRFRGHEVPGKGKGVDWEGALITQELYDARSNTLKFVPVVRMSEDERFVPEPLRKLTHYSLDTTVSYQDLLDFLHGVAGVEARPIGTAENRERRRGTTLSFADNRGSKNRVAKQEKGFTEVVPSTWRTREQHAALASWILGSVLLLYLMVIAFVFPEPTEGQIPLVRFFMGLLSGLFAYFFSGSIGIAGSLLGQKISASSGFALFVLVALVFNPFSVKRTAGDYLPSAVKPDRRILEAQADLHELQLLSKKPDGVRDSATTKAIQQIQLRFNLETNGVLNSATWLAIKHAAQERSSSSSGATSEINLPETPSRPQARITPQPSRSASQPEQGGSSFTPVYPDTSNATPAYWASIAGINKHETLPNLIKLFDDPITSPEENAEKEQFVWFGRLYVTLRKGKVISVEVPSDGARSLAGKVRDPKFGFFGMKLEAVLAALTAKWGVFGREDYMFVSPAGWQIKSHMNTLHLKLNDGTRIVFEFPDMQVCSWLGIYWELPTSKKNEWEYLDSHW